MPMSRDVITSEMARADQAVQHRRTHLIGLKVAEKAVKKDPALRHLESKVSQWRRRLKALDRVVQVNADCEARKAAGPAPKAVAEKKPKVKAAAAAPKDKAKEKTKEKAK